ncbi:MULTISPECIES: CoA transferase [Stappiaceae]|uniref:CaiB/BaiF CoA transferase family protein n=2 Tax=Hyphomicrobiales TaxID=356 RepID=UPI0012685118|nr:MULTISPECIES: CoA transferase [Stappiaceae]QFT01440.1 Formyl-coenzyme A transferase [Labrenzia sp. THAF191b]MBO6856469.1 CoA transferase [Roseibium sp.]QFT08147.1 Formyl-coenzyme A transferase [Labrenzia sp. THAF191a]QFT19489.1 Formyl-coenzyme A transferase [Labrenzia sp. THAF187b]UES53457.1 CoA transferase [Roseibium aggregatum]
MNTQAFPLSGVRILDFTQVMLGPCATQMLADFGADVIKIERPGAGDLSRHFFDVRSEEGMNNAVFSSLNRNKRSVEIDTKSDEGKQMVYDLVRNADVVVDNFRAGVMDRLGFGYEALKAINPRIICASGTGFGEKGPYAHKGGQDVLAQAMSGVMEKTADPSIERSIYPTTLCDYTAGMHLVQGILAALLARTKTGRGQRVSVSLYDSMIAMQMQEAAQWTKHREVLNWAAMPLTGVFDTTDGALVVVGAFKANPLRDICTALGIEDLSPTYPDLASQRANKPYLQDRFRAVFATDTTAHWIARLEEQDLLCAPVRALGEALEDPQTAINGMLLDFDHPVLGPLRVVGSPVHLSEAPLKLRHAPPRLGEHTDEVIAEFGLQQVAGAAE